MGTLVTADWLFPGTATRPGQAIALIRDPVIEIEDGRIAGFGPLAEREIPQSARTMHFPGATIAPAFFDIHIHGSAGHDVMEATPQSLQAVSRFLASRGTGNFLATTVTAPLDATLHSLAGLAQRIAESQCDGWPGAKPLGIHLEGPFLSHAKRGVHPTRHLLAPDTAVFDRMIEAAEGNVRLMTLAPELPGAAELAAHATAQGVRVSMGHSNATAAETQSAIAAGAASATHTFNAMRPLDHREPGILGTVLTTDSLYAELICDGIHVDPAMVRLWWRAKGSQRSILVTDAISATGMGDGEYLLGGIPVLVGNGRAVLKGPDGGPASVLAGSVLTLDRALRNFVAWTGEPVAAALPLLTRNPAAMTGFEDRAGSIQVGHAANFVVLDERGELLDSVIHGKSSRS